MFRPVRPGSGDIMLRFLIRLLDQITLRLGQLFAMACLPLVILVFANSLFRYIFGTGSLWAFEAVTYLFVILMCGLSGWALLMDEHVRVDILYQLLGRRGKAAVDLAGCLLLLFPFLWLLWDRGLPYVQRSWRISEGSVEMSGIPYVWALKTFLLVFVVLTALAGLSLALKSALRLAGDREI